MSNFDTVVLDGEMGLFTTIREGDLPYYTGATEVTPSDQTQTLPTADTIVTSNITINPIPDIDLEEVQVTYTPDEEGQTDTITPSTGYAGISEVEVTIEPIDSEYVGSDIPRNDSDDLTASGATVTAPAGYYENDATKTIASGSAATPATTITANPSISVGNDGSVTASVSATQSVTPSVTAGYVSSGTAGTITVSGSGSSQLSTQAGTTITPTTSQQTAVAAGKFTTGAVIVDAMPSGTAGTPTATKGTVSNHSVSVTPSVTNTTGYITGGTKTGTAVTVSASELVSGTKSITANGTNIDVTEYAAVDVAVPGDTPTLQTKSVSYTPTESAQSATVTADQGYDGLDEVNVSVGEIPSEYIIPTGTKQITENGTGIDVSAFEFADVNVSGGGLEEKAVNFYDYDGELLYAYDAAEFLALDAFPANPTHEGLTAQGWNWTLAGAKTYVTKYGFLQIGQTYEPTDGAAHVHIHIPNDNLLTFTIYCPVGSVDWGDNSGQETVTTAGNQTHTYATVGDYIIRILGSSSWRFSDIADPYKQQIREINLPKNYENFNSNQLRNLNLIERFTIPKNGLITDSNTSLLSAARNLKCLIWPITMTGMSKAVGSGESLKAICLNEGLSGAVILPAQIAFVKTITIPTGVTSITQGVIGKSFSLKTLIVPDGVTAFHRLSMAYNLVNLRLPTSLPNEGGMEASTLQETYVLEEINIPDGVTSMGTLCFANSNNCKKITIGKDVTNLGSQSLTAITLCTEIHMKPTTPPTRSTYNFNYKPSNCTIYVPYSADHSVLAAYQSATNWSNDAALMVEEQP